MTRPTEIRTYHDMQKLTPKQDADETNDARWEFVLGIILWTAFMACTSWLAGWI